MTHESGMMTEEWLAQHLRNLGWEVETQVLSNRFSKRGISIHGTLGKFTISLQAGANAYCKPREDGCTHYNSLETACWNGRRGDGGPAWVRTSYNSCDDVCGYLGKEAVLEYIAEVTKMAKEKPMAKTAIILCGISGSGKSTRAATMYPNAAVCSADHHFMVDGEYKFDPAKLSEAHGQCLRKFVSCLEWNEPLVVVDNTNTTIAEVAPYAALALAFGYDLRIEILKANPEEAAKRNLHGVPMNGILKMAERLEGLKKSLPPWWPCEEVS